MVSTVNTISGTKSAEYGFGTVNGPGTAKVLYMVNASKITKTTQTMMNAFLYVISKFVHSPPKSI